MTWRAMFLLCAMLFTLVGCTTPQPDGVSTADAPVETVAPIPSVTAPAVATDTAVASPAAFVGGANADVVFVEASRQEDGSWTFSVTVSHPDTGWEDYADGWDVVLPDGEVIRPDPDSPFTRLLLHPHENEQPFTRSQRGIIIPENVTAVTVRAHDLVDGFGGRTVSLDLTTAGGPDYSLQP